MENERSRKLVKNASVNLDADTLGRLRALQWVTKDSEPMSLSEVIRLAVIAGLPAIEAASASAQNARKSVEV